MAMLEKVRAALRISVENNADINDELTDLIAAAKQDLGIAGIESNNIIDTDPIITRAIITYCKMSFGLPEDYDRLKRSYDEQKAQLSNSTGYTDWGDIYV